VDYQSNNVRLRIPAASFEQAVEEEKGVEQKVHINRQHQLEAAIVRIMKSKRTLSHTVLVNEIFTQLKYPVDVS
jgi:cullin-4